MVDGNVELIKGIYSDDYALVTRKGDLRTRDERLRMLDSGQLRYLMTGEESEVNLSYYGHVAVVRGVISSAQTQFDGERRETGPRRFMAIWVHENGQWRQVGRQHTAIATRESAPVPE
jgi:hypothetical protein